MEMASATMTKSKTPPALKEYQKKRNFEVTSEPSGASKTKPAAKSERLYVIQKHAATNLHYDFRLEGRGVLLSCAAPKGPALGPSLKPVSTHVENDRLH